MIELVFIDDCDVISKAWVLHAHSNNKKIATYNTIGSFRSDITKFNLFIPIYLDSDLKDTISGQDFAKELYEYGFRNIYLCTGHSSDKFPNMFWIKEIVGKMPPF